LADFLLDFPAHLFVLALGFPVGIVRQLSCLFLNLTPHFVNLARYLLLSTWLILLAPLNRLEPPVKRSSASPRRKLRAAKISRSANQSKRPSTRDRVCPLDASRGASSCANESIPSPHHRAKTQREERSIWCPCLYLTCQRKLVDSPYFLRRQHHKRDEDGYLFTSRHIRVLFAFAVARKLLVLV
jgi:hypothetical protein